MAAALLNAIAFLLGVLATLVTWVVWVLYGLAAAVLLVAFAVIALALALWDGVCDWLERRREQRAR